MDHCGGNRRSINFDTYLHLIYRVKKIILLNHTYLLYNEFISRIENWKINV